MPLAWREVNIVNKSISWHRYLRFMNPAAYARPLWSDAAKHLYRLLFESEYRKYYLLILKYGGTPRYTKRVICVHGWKLIAPDVASFFSAYREIFVEEIYAFPEEHSNPVILDCGANIGLSVLYFKHTYPHAKIIAYEADPDIFAVLQENILANAITDIELHNQAIWSSETTVEFCREGADGGRIDGGQSMNVVPVPSVCLASILQSRTFDFVKIDIEGAEVEALRDADACLDRLHYVFVEFHSFVDRQQDLGSLISNFEHHGFRVHIHPPFTSKKPFFGIREQGGMDMQLNLFFWKR
jgi:FkbM family methyltransferase